jgi:hypothetical protein
MAVGVFAFFAFHAYLAVTNTTTSERSKRQDLTKWLLDTEVTEEENKQFEEEDDVALGKAQQGGANNATEKVKSKPVTPAPTAPTHAHSCNSECQYPLIAKCPLPTSPLSLAVGAAAASKAEKSKITSSSSIATTTASVPENTTNNILASRPIEATAQELALKDVRSKRPEGNRGWYEPVNSPWIVAQRYTKGDNLCTVPAPVDWTREYFTRAVTINAYECGAWIENLSESLGWRKEKQE